MIRGMRDRARGRLERSDGRSFDPADVDDGMPRVIVTVDRANPNADGTLPVHIDYFNMGSGTPQEIEGRVDNLLTLATRTWMRSQASGGVSHSVPKRSERGRR